MAYATTEQQILQLQSATVYIDASGADIVPEHEGAIKLSRPTLGYITDLCCSLHDYQIQEEELNAG